MFYTIMTIAILNTEILRMLLVEHTMKAKCNKGLFILYTILGKKEQILYMVMAFMSKKMVPSMKARLLMTHPLEKGDRYIKMEIITKAISKLTSVVDTACIHGKVVVAMKDSG